jgi:acyl carrier protein
MDLGEVHERLAEFSGIRQNAGNDEAALLEVALFVEDMLGIVLSDEEICEENLGTLEAIERFVRKKLDLGEACAESAE